MSTEETEEVADQVRASISRIPAQLPAGIADRAYRRTRRRRTTKRALAAAGTAAAAAAVATTLLYPRSATPATDNAAYVVSHVDHALSALPAGTIMFAHMTLGGGPDAIVTDTWAANGKIRVKAYTQTGQLASDEGHVTTAAGDTSVNVNYTHKTWSRSTGQGATAAPAVSFSCAVVSSEDRIYHSASQLTAWLRAAVSCGAFKAEGTSVIDDVKAVKLTQVTGSAANAAVTYLVNPETYLPVQLTIAFPHALTLQDDFQWLPATAANLAKLNLPAAPQNFTRVSG